MLFLFLKKLFIFSSRATIVLAATHLLAQDIVTSPAFSDTELTLQADFDNGSTIYDNACAACHGETGQGGKDGGPALTGNTSLSQAMLVIHDGRNTMPAFDVFTQQQLIDISTFVVERLDQ
jgi:mono/diheme cytochrome c family protein